MQTSEISDTSPTCEEVQKDIIKLKNNKASSMDNIPVAYLKCAEKIFYRATHPLIEVICRADDIPNGQAVIVLIYRKGDRMKCANYRGITLLNTR